MGQIVENKEPFCKPATNAAYMDQGVSTPVANQKAGRSRPGNRNAAAGVGARNGAEIGGRLETTRVKNTAKRSPLASHLVALIDREGRVTGVFAGRTAARSFLQGGWA
ncbi:hypothetical protein [Methylorubrum populi]